MYYNKTLAPDFALIRSKSIESYIGNYSPGTVETTQEAFFLLSACKSKGEESEVIGITCLESIGNQCKTLVPSDSFGIDCYIDGYGSLLTLGIFQKPDVFRDFQPHINDHGLFKNVDMVRQYAKAYCERAGFANLEPIDDLNELYIYAIFPVR